MTRRDCQLCVEARKVVESSARRYKLAVEVVDLDGEAPDVIEKFRREVPVILIDGKRRFSGHVSAVLFEREIKARKP